MVAPPGAGSWENRVPSTPPALARHRDMISPATLKPTYLYMTGCVWQQSTLELMRCGPSNAGTAVLKSSCSIPAHDILTTWRQPCCVNFPTAGLKMATSKYVMSLSRAGTFRERSFSIARPTPRQFECGLLPDTASHIYTDRLV